MPRARLSAGLATSLACVCAANVAQGATLDWKGHTWQLTSGGMAGVCQGDPANVSVDGDGSLHLTIRNSGGQWTAAELFTTDRLGFGTYQWHIDGPIDTYDKNVVLGLFPYGPAAGIGDDGTNEIDIEFARWGVANGPNGDFTNYPASGSTVGERSYTFSLDGSTLSTSRFVWTTKSITSSLLGGIVAVGVDDPIIETFAYEPSNPTQNIPQQALPLGMNLWCFDAPPSDNQPVEIVVRDFTFVPEGMGGSGTGGSGAGGSGRGGNGGGGLGGEMASSGGQGGGRGGRTNESAGAGAGGQATSGGAGGRPPGAGAAGTSAGAGTPSSQDGGRAGGASGGSSTPPAGNTQGCGCSVPSARHSALHGFVALALATLAFRRRRGSIEGSTHAPPGTG